MISAVTYVDVAGADTILGENLPWENGEAADKQTALEWAYVYLNANYRIGVQFDDQVTNPNQSLKNANALLANAHLSQVAESKTLFTSDTPKKGLRRSRVKAEVVESETEYDTTVSAGWTDPYPHVTAMLAVAGFPLSKSSGGFSTAPLVRR